MALSDVNVEVVEARLLAVVRFSAKPNELSSKIREALNRSEVYKAIPKGKAGLNMFLYRCAADSDTLDVELGVQLDEPFEETAVVKQSSTPAGRVAHILLTGPYSGIGEANAAILAWCQSHSERPAGVSWEVYGHWNDDETKLRTDIFYLLV